MVNQKDKTESGSFQKFNTAEIIFISLMVAANVGFDILVSPAVIALTTHIISGMLIMLPVNFAFMGLVKFSVNKFGSLSIYMTVFGVIASPLTFWGNTPGAWKILLGFLIGLLLDIIFLPKANIHVKIFIAGILAPIAWWTLTFSAWQLLGFPNVLGFSSMLNSAAPVYNGAIDFSSMMTLPITGFGKDFFMFCLMCGILSAGPTIIAFYIGLSIFKGIEKTAVYQRFSSTNE